MHYATIEIEPDDFSGFHAVVIDAYSDAVAHITDSYPTQDEAERAARAWLDAHPGQERSAS